MTRHGLTIIEVLLALTLLGVVAASVVGMFPNIVKLNRATAVDQTTTLAVKQFMESVRGSWSERARFDAATLANGAAVEGHALAGTPCTSRVQDPDAGAFTTPIRKRVIVSCSGAQPVAFVLELGRP